MLTRRGRGAVFALAMILATARAAGAEGLLDKNLHLFQPTVDGSGLITTYGSEPLGHFRMFYGLYGDVAADILDYEAPPDSEEATLIENQAGVNLVWAIGLSKYVNVGLAFPFTPFRTFDEEYDTEVYPHPLIDEFEEDDPDRPEGVKIGEDTDSFAFEDIRLDLKFILIDRLERCLGVGLVTTFGYPVLNNPRDDQYTSDGGLTVAPRLVADLGREWWTVVFNGGYKYFAEKDRARLPGLSEEVAHPNSGDFRTDDELMGGLGVKFRFAWGQELMLDSAVRTFASDPFGDSREDYAEVMGAYRKFFRGFNFTALTIGGGVGLTDGIGTPAGRLFIGITREENRLHIMSLDRAY
ncbi:hypothetical protein K8I61_09515 [bacterium]|nr:hypothetical protein [bacterium]